LCLIRPPAKGAQLLEQLLAIEYDSDAGGEVLIPEAGSEMGSRAVALEGVDEAWWGAEAAEEIMFANWGH
jgi:hypothetical protein